MPTISVRPLGGSPRDRFDHEVLRHEYNLECPNFWRIDPRGLSVPGSGWLNPTVEESLRRKDSLWLVSRVDGELAGQARCDIVSSHTIISELYVRRELRNLGVARTLFDIAVAWGEPKTEFVTLSVEETNPAIYVYEHLGLRVVKTLDGESCGESYRYHIMTARTSSYKH